MKPTFLLRHRLTVGVRYPTRSPKHTLAATVQPEGLVGILLNEI
jgi:hypothetical protein